MYLRAKVGFIGSLASGYFGLFSFSLLLFLFIEAHHAPSHSNRIRRRH